MCEVGQRHGIDRHDLRVAVETVVGIACPEGDSIRARRVVYMRWVLIE